MSAGLAITQHSSSEEQFSKYFDSIESSLDRHANGSPFYSWTRQLAPDYLPTTHVSCFQADVDQERVSSVTKHVGAFNSIAYGRGHWSKTENSVSMTQDVTWLD